MAETALNTSGAQPEPDAPGIREAREADDGSRFQAARQRMKAHSEMMKSKVLERNGRLTEIVEAAQKATKSCLRAQLATIRKERPEAAREEVWELMCRSEARWRDDEFVRAAFQEVYLEDPGASGNEPALKETIEELQRVLRRHADSE